MLFLMLDTLERKSNMDNATHPNPLTRFVSVMSACQSFIEEYGLDKLDYSLQNKSPIATCMSWWSKQGFSEIETQFSFKHLRERVPSEIDELWQTLEPHREVLDEFKAQRYATLGI